jgi:phage FluMu gp28-like protein
MTDRFIYIVLGSHGLPVAAFDCKQLAEDFAKEFGDCVVETLTVNERAGEKLLPTYRCDIDASTGEYHVYNSGMRLMRENDIQIKRICPGTITVISSISKEHAIEVARSQYGR